MNGPTGSRGLPPEIDPRAGARRPPGATAMPGRQVPAARRVRRVLRWLAASLAVLVVVVSSGGWAALTLVERGLLRVDVFSGLADRPEKGSSDAVNYLLVGSDKREGLSAKEIRRLRLGRAEGQRADTMILLHVSRARDQATMISFPRDSYVKIPEYRAPDGTTVPAGRNKLNAAYSIGGPQLAVATIEQNTGIRIDHYVEVNFAGFEQIVNAVGGVEVCTRKPLDDERAGLHLQAGRTVLDGQAGLAYVRARYLDGRGDIGRIERQQRFLGSVAAKAMSSDVLLNPRRLTSLVDAARDATTTDPGLRRDDILMLADRLRNMSPKQMQFLTVPMADLDYRVRGIGSTVLWDDAAAKAVFESIRADRPAAAKVAPKPRATVEPGRIRVKVLNGSGVTGLGARAAKDLSGAGYALAGRAANAGTEGAEQTVVRYDDRYTTSVKTLQAALPGARFEAVPRLGSTFEITVGSAYDGVRPVKIVERAARPAGDAPTRTAADDVCA